MILTKSRFGSARGHGKRLASKPRLLRSKEPLRDRLNPPWVSLPRLVLTQGTNTSCKGLHRPPLGRSKNQPHTLPDGFITQRDLGPQKRIRIRPVRLQQRPGGLFRHEPYSTVQLADQIDAAVTDRRLHVDGHAGPGDRLIALTPSARASWSTARVNVSAPPCCRKKRSTHPSEHGRRPTPTVRIVPP